MDKESIEKEFNDDIKELLARDDIQCRPDICEAEYAKIMKLLERPTREELTRALGLMGYLAFVFDYAPAAIWRGEFSEMRLGDLPEAIKWYRFAAELKDPQGAFRYANMLAAGKGIERNLVQARKYYAFAAENGIAEAIFVMGEYLRNEGKREEALMAYKDALAKGYTPAQGRVKMLMKRYN